jgi:hypothetical protein
MSNGYLVAASVDLAALDDIAQGFGLDIIAAHAITDRDAVGAALAGAANIGIVLSVPAAREDAFVALLQVLADRVKSAQLILVEPDALRAFAFLPALWPTMSIEEARARAAALLQGRQQAEAPTPPAPTEVEPASEPMPVTEQEPPPVELSPEPAPEAEQVEHAAPEDQEFETVEPPANENADEPIPAVDDGVTASGGEAAETLAGEDALPPPSEPEPPAPPLEEITIAAPEDDARAITIDEGEPALAAEPEPAPDAASDPAPAPIAAGAPAPAAPPPQTDDNDADKPEPPPLARKRSKQEAAESARGASAPADATAFAPKKLRRGEAELVRIAIHQPKDLQAVIKAARKADPRTDSAPQSMGIGEVALGASVGVALEVKGAACDGSVQRRTWEGEPLEFSFAATADADVRQVVVLARVFVNDAQIGVLAFTRGVTGPRPKAMPDGERVRLKRHKRVFLSYSSKDRETVSAIATAYQMAGVEHFWDRASLKSGEEWGPRLRREIDRCDLFHLCWSKSAAASEWVEKETAHAISLRRSRKRPDISIQMLDGPPWAKHPDSLDAINFDDFVRAAIVGYARGEGEA